MNDDAQLAYVAEHVEQRLSTDERAHALGISVKYEDGQLILSGQVNCESRRQDIEQVARELAPPGVDIQNRVEVTRIEGSVEEEVVE